MTQHGLRFNLIRAYCFVVIDASIILHHIFNEEEFRSKIEYFLNINRKEKIHCEVLPKTVYEVNKRITEAANEFHRVLTSCKKNAEVIARKPLSKLVLDRNSAHILRKTFTKTFNDISRYCHQFTIKREKLRRARIVEAAVMMEFFNNFGTKKLNMEQFFQNIKNSFGDIYKQFCLKQSTLMKEIGATAINKSQIPGTSGKLIDIFSTRCRIKNRNDIELLCEAVCRMYKTNKWCAVTTTDYTDMVQKAPKIERLTLLIVTDPLYFLYRLDSKLDWATQPKSAASRVKIRFASFSKSTEPAGIV